MKVLIVSHNPVATQGNMSKTFLSLFSQFKKEELCQLYIYPSLPDVDRCGSYYRVTDKEILASLKSPFRHGKVGGEIERAMLSSENGLYEHSEDEALYRNRKNRSPIRRLMRDAMWSVSGWYNDRLEKWLERERPSCIFVAPGVAKFIYNVALAISRRLSIPIITYICDEYYFVKEPQKALDKLRLSLLRSKIGQLMKASSHLVVISEELRKAYSEHFGVSTSTFMTGAGFAAAQTVKRSADEPPRSICYFGNIRSNRYLSLCEVGRALDALNEQGVTDCKLKIYTSEKNGTILSAFDGIRSIELCGFVTGEAYRAAFEAADMLLHTESFEEQSIDAVRHSVSTKIADSLASGIPLFAYGPDCVSSMKHLIRHDCAICATSRDQLGDMLRKALSDGQLRERTAMNSLRVAAEYHDSAVTSSKLRMLAAEVSGEEISV